MIKVIIFDYDGVIVDSFSVIHKIYLRTCTQLGKKCPKTISGFRKVYGLNSRECYKNLEFTEEQIKKADELFREEIVKKSVSLFPGIKEVLVRLSQKYQLVLLSSSYQVDIQNRLRRWGLEHYFAEIVGQERELSPLRKREALPLLIKRLGILPAEMIMVGDRETDYRCALDNGITKVILVEYGWGYDRTRIPEYTPQVIVRNPKDIIKAVEVLDI